MNFCHKKPQIRIIKNKCLFVFLRHSVIIFFLFKTLPRYTF
ncbi:hypothetical protein PLEI_3821 [Photobacterium leiognathi lrivu.4.1]|uniref:Uncharacterized protein n=1 Tax=Photobacterium leiognathi lrivu.4.1 TaxID=1248232 RepID=V5H561_PHOLE|nr:hypothetical protein PLEI_3821 [Photobacterium leiognathi lrivu.4.1]